MATWPSTLPAPQKNIGIVPGDTRIDRKLQSGRTEFRKFGDGKPDQMKALFRLTWAEWDIFKEFHMHELNLGINWFSADWLTDLGYDAHKARILGYPREIALQNHYVDVFCSLIVQATTDIVTEDTVWPCEPTGTEPEPPPAGTSYVYAGYSTISLQDCDEFVSTNVWANKADIPLPARESLAASTIGSSGYIYGGSYIQDCDKYTPNVWTSKTDMPLPARGLAAASTIGVLGYIYCGAKSIVWNGFLQDCDEYNTLDTWASKTDAPAPTRKALAASTIGSSGYIYCGWAHSPGILQDCDEYTPDVWASKTDAPLPVRQSLAAFTLSTFGYIAGGTSGVRLQDCDEYSGVFDVWANKANMPLPARFGLAASTMGSSGYVYGGYAVSPYVVLRQDCDRYIVNTWVSMSDMPSPGRYSLAASTI